MPLVAALLALLAAAPAQASDSPPAVPAPTAQQYRIGAGDSLQVQVFGEPTLSGVFPVDDAGQVDYPLVGAVPVKGLSPSEAGDLLRARLTPDYLLNPNITVSVATYHSQPVQVIGAVAKPGTYYLRGPTTALQIIGEAGGLSRDGVKEIKLSHGGQGDDGASVPYEQLLATGPGAVMVESGDIVSVPLTLVTVMGQVAKPGEVTFREGLTISQAIAAAGGALPTADLGRVYILRGEKRIRVSLRKILSGKAPDVTVQVGDRVIVQESLV